MAEMLRVAVVRGEPLLERGVLQALSGVADIEVEVVPFDAADVIGSLDGFKPHAIIAGEMEAGFLGHILAGYPRTAVLTLGLESRQLDVYRSRHAAIRSIEDLVLEVRKEVEKAQREIAGEARNGI